MESDTVFLASERDAIPGTGPQHDHAREYALLASLADAVYCVDPAGSVTFANAAFEAMTGYALADLQGTASIYLYVPEAEALFMERRRQVYSGATVSPYLETVLLRKDGSRLAVELSVSSLILEGQIAGRVAVLRDLTARRQDDQALRENGMRRLATQSTNAPESLENLWAEIRQRLGVCPSFFRLATPDPPIARTLFDLAKFAYLDSSLPAVFKEKLFTYLSRFCPVRYCVARHAAFLLGRGYTAGDPQAPALPAEEVAALLDEPLPEREELPRLLAELEVQPVPLADWPEFESRLGRLVRVACTRVFLEPEQSATWCKALRRLLEPQRYEQLMLFVAFVRTAHFWTEVHPELELEGDVEALLEEHKALANSILNDIDTTLGSQIGARLAAELQELRHAAALTDALRESEARFQLLANVAPVLIWVNGPDGCEFVNRPYLEFLGVSSETDVRGTDWLPYVHPDDREAYVEAYLAALAGRLPFAAQFRFRRADGVYRWFQSMGTPRLLPDGTFLGYVGCSFDVTEQREAEAVLERRIAERTTALEQAMAERQRLEREAQRVEHFALLGRLAAGVSHELRNPLAAVFLQVDLFTEELAQPSPDSRAVLAEALAELKTELARVDDIVQDYLSLVRVHAIQCEMQDLGVAVMAWCREFQEVVAPHGVTLQVDGVEKLGLVAFHTSMLCRALLNLVQNAAEATPQSGTVTLAGQSTAHQVQIQVRDTGSGISAERLTQIFEPLYTTKPGGTGLGLYLVQEILTAHGGQVTVHSVESQGTTFTLTLPRTGRAVSGVTE